MLHPCIHRHLQYAAHERTLSLSLSPSPLCFIDPAWCLALRYLLCCSPHSTGNYISLQALGLKEVPEL